MQVNDRNNLTMMRCVVRIMWLCFLSILMVSYTSDKIPIFDNTMMMTDVSRIKRGGHLVAIGNIVLSLQ